MDLRFTPPARKPLPPRQAKISPGLRANLSSRGAVGHQQAPEKPEQAQAVKIAPKVTEPATRPVVSPRRPSVELLKRGLQNLKDLAQKAFGRVQRYVRENDVNFLDWRHPNFHTVAPVAAALTLIAAFGLVQFFSPDFYQLTPASQALVGPVNTKLSKQLSYDKKQHLIQYNQQSIGGGAQPDSPQAALAASKNAKHVGGGAKNYAVNLATDSTKGTTVYDTTDTTGSLAISMIPEFKTRDGKLVDGRVVYPLKGFDGKLVYSVKGNGLKEDLVIPEEQGDSASFTYQLKLPNSLEARLMDDGSVGIYSADQALFGNISYGTDADRAKVEAARQNSQKTNLVFAIPAPIITQTGKGSNSAKAKFELTGDSLVGQHLTVKATGLSQASYPLSIDPSIAVTSAADFTDGNLESNIQLDTSNNIVRSGLTGGTTGAWHYTHNSTDDGTTAVSGLTNSRDGAGLAAYNGFLYAIAGRNTSGTQQTDIQYAPINSNGTIGSWSVMGTSIQQTRNKPDIYIYNGYMYVMGGVVSAANSTEIAKINKDGTIGAFSYGPALNRYRINGTFVGYNGYIYAIGGCYNYTSSCLNITGAVEFTKIQGDGTLSAWHYTQDSADTGTTVSGLPAAKMAHGADIYNGYVYVAGGCTAIDCSTATSQVLYAPLNADGTVGTWVTSSNGLANSLTTNIRLIISDGYMYATGDGSSTIIYAYINADGSNGVWASTAAATNATFSKMMIGYSGYLYLVGGYNSGYINFVQYAKINTAGATGNYAASSNLYTAPSGSAVTFDASVVAYNGYLYVIGGCSVVAGIGGSNGSNTCNGANVVGQVLYAQINSDGSLGAFTKSASSLAVARYGGSAVAFGGRLYYVAGALGGAGGVSNDVQYSSAISSGNPGAWTQATGAFTGGRYMLATAVFNSRIYVIGGCNNINSCNSANGNDYNDVWSVPINSDGTVSNNSGTSLGTYDTNGRQKLAATYYGGYLYVSGGWHGTSFSSDVRYIKVNSDGSFTGNSWQDGGHNFSTVRGNHGMFVNNGYLYIVGGCSALDSNQVCTGVLGDTQYAPLDLSTGAVGVWNTVTMPALNTSRYAAGAAAYNGNVYMASGCSSGDCTSISNNVEIALINNGGSGTTGSWTSSTPANFGNPRYGVASVAYGGYLYVTGGYDSATYFSNTLYAPIASDGTIGSWSTTSDFSAVGTARLKHTAVVYNGYMYIVAGSHNSFETDTLYAPICTGANTNDGCTTSSPPGSLGTWASATPHLATGRWGHATAVYNGYIYVTGGCSAQTLNGCSASLTDTQYALLCTNSNVGTDGCAAAGSIGNWHSGSSYTANRWHHQSVVVNGYLYVIGGCGSRDFSNACLTNLSDVQYAKINSDGSLGSYNYTNGFTGARYGHGVAVMNGYMYIFGGANNNTVLDNVEFASINTNGTLGAWSKSSAVMSTARLLFGSASYNGRLYAVAGGTNASYGSGTFVTTVERVGLKSVAREGTYSYLADLAGDAVATNLLYHGTISNSSQTSIGLKDATNVASTFGSATNYLLTSPGNLQAFPASEKRYRQLVFTLDDSQSASFPDSLGPVSTISDFDLYFHAATGKRLRGGKTFTSEKIRSLDATPYQ